MTLRLVNASSEYGKCKNHSIHSLRHCLVHEDEVQVITLIIFYKRRPIRDGRQIVEKNKRQGLAFSKKLRDSAHWGPEAVEAEFALEAI